MRPLDGFSNLVRVGQLWFAGRGLEVRLQRHVNHLNDGRDRRNGDRLKLSLQTVGEGFRFLSLRERVPTGCPRGEMERELS